MNKSIPMMAASMFTLSVFSGTVLTESSDTNIPVTQYDYSDHLDVAKVISTTPVPDNCEVSPMTMKYEDSKGQLHILKYEVLGNGCDNS